MNNIRAGALDYFSKFEGFPEVPEHSMAGHFICYNVNSCLL